MNELCKVAVKQLSNCNHLLGIAIEQENWLEVNSVLKNRLLLLDDLASLLDPNDDNQEIIHFYQNMLNSDNIFIESALKQKKEIYDKLHKIKKAEKALPAYQAFQK
jgi:hypothetical protein